jgi:hypothetical protein
MRESWKPSGARTVVLPRYILPLPSTISVIDIEYLESKGAFSVPGERLREELLAAYVQYVHPDVPFLDVPEFLQATKYNSETAPPVSLLLFQAVMFAGVAFADLGQLKIAGYADRKIARSMFFERVKVWS